ncbi:hypothetical protein [Algoriphagus sediminis]|uniref:Uncharacterized protein n=1 Tax=Algoriphagus sediminis TaxID=3057113 RepID=A0ABT7YGC7_9BACT|nr:hypothetical protein [Algoriphagus sediminis]MDN3205583.1 hypothetical protein [Algoriphagus sediminis]
MLLVITQGELENLIRNFSKKKIRIEFLGENQLKLKTSGVSLLLFLVEVKPRQVSFAYKMNTVVNFFVEKFLKLDKPGISWDRDQLQIKIDLDQVFLDDKSKDIYLRQLVMDEEKMIIDFYLAQPNPENPTEI